MARSDWGIGIVGLGGIARQHLEGYRRQGLKVVGGAEIDEARRSAVARDFNLSFVTADYRELIARADVRIVDITVPHTLALRQPIIAFAAQHQKAMFVQKPLLPYLNEARQLVAIAERHGAPMMVNQNSIFVPAFRAMEPYLRDEKYLGTPYWFQIENVNWFDPGAHGWYGKAERWVTSDMAIHHFALVRHWFGEWDSVYALMAHDDSQKHIKGDTLSSLLVRFQSGVQGLILNNWSYRGHRPRPHSTEEITIQGTRGCISGNSKEICVTTTDPPAKIYPTFRGDWFPDAFGNAMAHFVDALDTGTPFLCEARDNLNAVAMIEAAYLSVKEQRAVRREELMGS
ncbi:MAG: Gfo/Idh/MocA family oxidoreductase [Abditibacteriales bacterium]|nr:Gfo/Idh/MocA family oxidoreductase [Abditibacteriales bacterium]MDW8367503.1 Gfo/Idh/MocA family oxidoreductase [Abditibacteriales bacterium]